MIGVWIGGILIGFGLGMAVTVMMCSGMKEEIEKRLAEGPNIEFYHHKIHANEIIDVKDIGLTDLVKLSIEELEELKQKINASIRVRQKDMSIDMFSVGDIVSFHTKIKRPGAKRRTGEKEIVQGEVTKVNRKMIKIQIDEPKEMAGDWNIPPHCLTIVEPSFAPSQTATTKNKSFMDELKEL